MTEIMKIVQQCIKKMEIRLNHVYENIFTFTFTYFNRFRNKIN